jgi:endoglucanase
MARAYLAPVLLSLSLLASSIAVGVAGCDEGGVAQGLGITVTPTGCTPAAGASLPPTAPDGYYVNGNTVCTPAGKPHLLHGVDRPSMEWSATGQNLSAADFAAMAGWHANVVRVALDQDFWLSDSPEYAPGYAALVDQVVQWAHAAGMDVILDLHWSDTGDYSVKPAQQLMADANHSIKFWQEVATRYMGDGRVFFELYNEPHDIPGNVWQSGGMYGGYMVAGMQQLYAAVRGVGANNLVIIGGLDYAFDLSVVASYPVQGYNIAYATHPYNNAPGRQPGEWDTSWGYLTQTAPVVVTEFGDGTGSCSPVWDETLIPYADAHHAGWTSWAWFVGGTTPTALCQFPSLITDWSYDTTNEGAVVKAALLGYDDPAAPWPVVDAGSDASLGDAAPDGPDTSGDAGADGSSDAGAADDGGVDAADASG